MKKQVSHKIVSLVFVIIVVCFAVAFYVVAWDEPTQGPPGCPSGEPGCDPPVNVGATSQVKEGALGVYGVFRAVGGADPAIEPGLVVNNGNVGIGTTNPKSKLQVNGGHLQIPYIHNNPGSEPSCTSLDHMGRMLLATDEASAGRLWICNCMNWIAANCGWKYVNLN